MNPLENTPEPPSPREWFAVALTIVVIVAGVILLADYLWGPR